jgi:hypothetical protein
MLVAMDLTSDLARIAGPVVIIAGALDATRPLALVEAIAGRIRNARYLLLPTATRPAYRDRGNSRLRGSRVPGQLPRLSPVWASLWGERPGVGSGRAALRRDGAGSACDRAWWATATAPAGWG